MSGSGTVRVLKRDGSAEDFNRRKLAAAMCKAMRAGGSASRDALELAGAIETYLVRRGARCVSSAAVFEMTAKVLRRVNLHDAAQAMEQFHTWRRICRQRLLVRHEGGRLTSWDKSWLARMTSQTWNLEPSTGRFIAGQIEMDLLDGEPPVISRQALLRRMNHGVLAWGLADAVPVGQYAVPQ